MARRYQCRCLYRAGVDETDQSARRWTRLVHGRFRSRCQTRPRRPSLRLLSYAFLHDPGDIFHILFNMLFLWWFGSDVEDLYGPREFLSFYLTAALARVCCSFSVRWFGRWTRDRASERRAGAGSVGAVYHSLSTAHAAVILYSAGAVVVVPGLLPGPRCVCLSQQEREQHSCGGSSGRCLVRRRLLSTALAIDRLVAATSSMAA